jgi:transposase
MDDHTLDPNVGDVRRIEVITGAGRRRRWPADVKARIVAESFSGEVPASEVARRHGIRPQQLFGWRRELRAGHLMPAREPVPSFVPIVAEPIGAGAAKPRGAMAGAAIEIAIGEMIVRLHGHVAAGALAEVLAAVKLGKPARNLAVQQAPDLTLANPLCSCACARTPR